MVAHNIPYVAQTTPYHWKDLATKVEKALAVDGPAFINILMPCTVGWHFDPALGIEHRPRSGRDQLLAAVRGRQRQVHRSTTSPRNGRRWSDWMKKQGRFKHLFVPGNEPILKRSQEWVDQEWEKLLKLEAMTAE